MPMQRHLKGKCRASASHVVMIGGESGLRFGGDQPESVKPRMRSHAPHRHHQRVDSPLPSSNTSSTAEQVVGNFYQAFRRRDLRTLGALLATDVRVTWDIPESVDALTGRDEVCAQLARFINASDGTALATPTTIFAGRTPRIVVIQNETGRWAGSEAEQTAAVTFEIVNGLITTITRLPRANGTTP